MHPVTELTLKKAEAIIDAALAKGREKKFAPLTVVVLDAGGHAVALKREDNSGIIRVQIATAKAYGALGMGFNSRELGVRAQTNAPFIGALSVLSEGKLAPAAGGVLILGSAGQVIGAVGISGDTSDNDEICSFAGIKAAGFKAFNEPA
ncbi:MAG TPA: heme-binding protein [Stellaceae bacterium]|jgi:uncharacterized protein GlcG (DUF336 family)|nr:heme-binding protein [Stellaceae bacterium]